MTTVIKLKRSETPSQIPSAGSLEAGELAMNVTDGKFYTKTSGGTVLEVGGAGSVTLQDVTDNGAVTTNDLTLNGSNLVFEGALENAFETTLTVAEPDADRTITLPNVSGTAITTGNLTGITSLGTLTSDITLNNSNIIFEGSTEDDFETTLTVTDPTADRTITLTNRTGTAAVIESGRNIVVEGTSFNTTLTVTDPTADRTITLPNQSGTVAMDGDALAYSIVFGG